MTEMLQDKYLAAFGQVVGHLALDLSDLTIHHHRNTRPGDFKQVSGYVLRLKTSTPTQSQLKPKKH